MTIKFTPAVREGVTLLVGLSGGTGSGKSYSGMRLAAGIAGDKPFAVIDTEARRALHYADLFRFDHAELKPPFRPAGQSLRTIAASMTTRGFRLTHAGVAKIITAAQERAPVRRTAT